jgi:4-diphosphocytidyl-2-C-methyl-D-erythritol kinase
MCPKIKEIKDRMIQAGAIGALMSGSGSSVFGVFESEDDAKRASLNLEGMGSIFIVHSVK